MRETSGMTDNKLEKRPRFDQLHSVKIKLGVFDGEL